MGLGLFGRLVDDLAVGVVAVEEACFLEFAGGLVGAVAEGELLGEAACADGEGLGVAGVVLGPGGGIDFDGALLIEADEACHVECSEGFRLGRGLRP